MTTISDSVIPEQMDDDGLARRLQRHCARAEEFLADERRRMENIERELLGALSSMEEQLLQSAEAAKEFSAKTHEPSSAAFDGVAAERDELRAECRTLQERIAELEDQIAAGPGEAQPAVDSADGAGGGGFNWESQKQRLLAALDSSGDSQSDEEIGDRATIESTIQTTDRIVAAKDREIEQLRRKLQQLKNSTASAAESDREESVDEILNTDEIIQQEREKLLLLQEEMREKQRKSEIEISLERARLARERVALEEKIATFEEQAGQFDESDGDDQVEEETGNKSRSRWMARLGLGES